MSNTLKLGNGQWATGKDTLLGYNSENNNIKPLPFSFSRDSSATVVNKDGLIETVGSGEPRIDFKDNTKGALLLEPTRSNIVLTSASGTYGNGPASETNTISPDGTNNAVIPTPDSTSDRYAYAISGGIYSTNSKLAYSWYRKRISTPIDTSYVGDLYLTLIQNATQVGSTTQIQSDVNGYDRFEAVFNITDGSATTIIRGYFGILLGVGNSSIAYWGHQIEEGSYATSYIPTSGSAVTRVADSSSQTVPDGIYGTNEVTFVIDFEINGDTPTYSNIFNTNKNTASSFGATRQDENGRLKPFLFSSGINVGDMTSTTAFLNGVRGKFAVGYKNGDSVLVVKGNVEDTNSATFSDFNVNEIHLNDLVTYFGYHTNLKIYDFKLYNTRLSNSELAALTQ